MPKKKKEKKEEEHPRETPPSDSLPPDDPKAQQPASDAACAVEMPVASVENCRSPGLSAVRLWLRRKARDLTQSQALVPRELVADLDNVIVWLEVQETRELVHNYVRLAEIVRFWCDYVKEEERRVHRKAKRVASELDGKKRMEILADKGKVTEAAVQAKVYSDEGYRRLIELEADWQSLAYQIQNLINSMQTDMMVQESVWAQREYQQTQMIARPTE